MKPRLSTIVVSLAALTSPASGFLPGVGSDSFLPNLLLDVVAPRTISHADQTKRGILDFLEQHYGIDNPQYGFEAGFFRNRWPRSVKVARNLIVDANEGVDGNKHGFREKNYGPAHFDNEYLEESQNHLMMLRSQMIQMIQNGFRTYFSDTNVNQARIFLGRQLHTLQDFYAHSNWVEMGRSTISDVVGRPGATIYPRTPADVPTCSQYCINPGSLTDHSRAQYMTMLDCYRGCFHGDSSSDDLTASRRCAVKCAEPDLFCRVSTECETHACANNTIELERVTTGYYRVHDDPNSVKPAGKCSHGGLNDNGTIGLEGINKDSTLETYSPHWFLHRAAAKLATEHTKQYLLALLQDWPTVTIDGTEYPQPKLTEVQLRMLLGLNPSPLAVVIDRSRSMATALGPLKSAIGTMVRRLQTMGFSPPEYVLVTYGLYPLDEATDVLVTPDINVFLEKLMSITPESDMTPTCARERYEEGIVHAARRVSDRSQILVFTDRPARESGGSRPNPAGYPYLPEGPLATQQFRSAILQEYTRLTDPKGIDTFVFEIPNQPGYPYSEHPWEACRLAPTAPGDKSALSAFATSFIRYPMRANLGGLASAAIHQIMRVTSRGPGSHTQDLWYETHSITSTGTAEREAAERELFVDPSVESLTLTVWDEIESQEDVTNLVLTRPDGTTVGEADPDAGWHWDAPSSGYKGSRVIVVDTPQPGTWRITRRRARTGVQVVMSTSISFTFDFVEDDYFSDAHPGWQLSNSRNYGEQAGFTLSFDRYPEWRFPHNYTMRAQLDGPIASIEGFYLHTYDSGAVIMQLNMTRINDFEDDNDDFNTGDQIYFGILDAASLPYCGDFFASVVGTDRNGVRFQRTEVGVYTNSFVRNDTPRSPQCPPPAVPPPATASTAVLQDVSTFTSTSTPPGGVSNSTSSSSISSSTPGSVSASSTMVSSEISSTLSASSQASSSVASSSGSSWSVTSTASASSAISTESSSMVQSSSLISGTSSHVSSTVSSAQSSLTVSDTSSSAVSSSSVVSVSSSLADSSSTSSPNTISDASSVTSSSITASDSSFAPSSSISSGVSNSSVDGAGTTREDDGSFTTSSVSSWSSAAGSTASPSAEISSSGVSSISSSSSESIVSSVSSSSSSSLDTSITPSTLPPSSTASSALPTRTRLSCQERQAKWRRARARA